MSDLLRDPELLWFIAGVGWLPTPGAVIPGAIREANNHETRQ
jgi:hypothetical protein